MFQFLLGFQRQHSASTSRQTADNTAGSSWVLPRQAGRIPSTVFQPAWPPPGAAPQGYTEANRMSKLLARCYCERPHAAMDHVHCCNAGKPCRRIFWWGNGGNTKASVCPWGRLQMQEIEKFLLALLSKDSHASYQLWGYEKCGLPQNCQISIALHKKLQSESTTDLRQFNSIKYQCVLQRKSLKYIVCSNIATLTSKMFLWDWRTSSNARSGVGIRMEEATAESACKNIFIAYMVSEHPNFTSLTGTSRLQ